MAIRAFANPAGNADRLEPAFQIQPVGIDHRGGVDDLAAKPDGKAAHRRKKGAAGLGHVARKAKIAHTVGGFGQLAQEMAGGLEGPVHVPQRAGPAKAGKLQAGGRVALGDGARLINADKEKRNAFGSGALQCGKPVRDLFDGCPELARQTLQIVAAGLRRRKKGTVRHQGRAGEIVCQTDFGNVAGCGRLKPGQIQRGFQQLVLGLQRDLVKQLKPLGRRCGLSRQIKPPGFGVKQAQGGRARKIHVNAAFAQHLGCVNQHVLAGGRL